MSPLDNEMYKSAKEYQALGLPIIPCKGKIPTIKGWTKRGCPTDKTLTSWFNASKTRNIGLVLGGITGNMIAVDGDGPDAMAKLTEILGGPSPDTWMFNTPGGGWRLLFKVAQGVTYKKHLISLEGEHSELAFLGDGQQTILPPSIHPNGGVYEWIKGHKPSDIPLSDAPQAILTLMTTSERTEIAVLPSTDSPITVLESKCLRFRQDWQTQQTVGLTEQQWFHWASLFTSVDDSDAVTLFSSASKKHNSKSVDRISKLQNSEKIAMTRCSTLGCAKTQILACFPGNPRFNDKKEMINSPGAFLVKMEHSELSPALRTELEEKGFYFKEGISAPNGLKANKFALYALSVIDLLYLGPQDRFYSYADGYWTPLDDNQLSRSLLQLIEPYTERIWYKKLEDEYVNFLKRNAKRIESIASDRQFINLENGMLDLTTFELVAHAKEFHSTVRVPIRYELEATCPKFLAFLEQVFEGDAVLTDIVRQVFGYCLTSETKTHQTIIFYGAGSNGKSVLLDVLMALCGEANVSAVSLRDLDNSFHRYNLVDKILNISTENEMGTSELNTQYLKAITSGEPIQVERKYEQSFLYRPFCKLVFAVNNLPWSMDASEGFYRRLKIIPFNRTFSGKEKDVDLTSKLKSELPGILNWSLGGLKALRQNSFLFPISKAISDTLEEYKESSTPILQFVRDMIKQAAPDKYVKYVVLANHYQSWCDMNGLVNSYTKGMAFAKQIKNALKGEGMKTGRFKSGGVRGISGIRLLKNGEKDDDSYDEME